MKTDVSRFTALGRRVHPTRRHLAPGFTLIEMLVVILFAGVLMAIAAPGWSAFITRQRTTAIRSDITQVLRKAQADAIRTRTPRAVVFDTAATATVPRAAIVPFPLPAGGIPAASWQQLGGDAIPANAISLRGFGLASSTFLANTQTFVFDSNGAVATAQSVSGMADQLSGTAPFIMAVQTRNSLQTQNVIRSCVIVQTLLGSLRTSDNPADCSR